MKKHKRYVQSIVDSGNTGLINILIDKKIESRIKGILRSDEIAFTLEGQALIMLAVEDVLSNLKGIFKLKQSTQ